MKRRILVVDDEADIRDIICNMLSGDKYEAVPASNGEAALDYMKKEPVDLVLLDIMMPGMDGLETAHEMRKFTKTPIIVVSIKADDLCDAGDAKYNFSDCVQKPFDMDTLLDAVRRALA